METVEGFLRDRIHDIDQGDYIARLIDDLLRGETNPYTAALEISRRLARDLCQPGDTDGIDQKSAER
jgi:hypothetical protein